ncbi:MAG: Na+/H+ antiporter subunit E [Rickettsiaceae bacterium]|nr:Na+/H+ antiporter subunit E [Rickettsiaceae bacterium]
MIKILTNLIFFILFWLIVKSIPHNFLDIVFLVVCVGNLYLFANKYRLLTTFKPTMNLLYYLVNLIVDIYSAAIAVSKIIWRKDMHISDNFMVIKASKVNNKTVNSLIANYITLTPGTYTVSIDDNIFLIHCLTNDDAKSLEKSFKEIEERTIKLIIS